jgi:hypothetical protein
MQLVSGIDPWENTIDCFRISTQKLGINIHAPLAQSNAPRPVVSGGTWQDGNLRFSDIGVYPTNSFIELLPEIDKAEPLWVFNYDAIADGFLTEQRLKSYPQEELQASYRKAGGLQGHGQIGSEQQLREIDTCFAKQFGNKAVMYHLYYTTLFMWPVVTFGWEAFMIAAALEPDRFDEVLWQPWSQVSRKYFEVAATLSTPVLFCHDDLTTGTGPVFSPDFYEKYIFPKYEYILEPAVKANKKIVFVCDGNMEVFLERLLDMPFAAIQPETPATPLESILNTWGKAGRGFIGGIQTNILTNGTVDEVKAHTKSVIEKAREYPGFIISSCGGLHGNIPLKNIIAYFQTRNELGITAEL